MDAGQLEAHKTRARTWFEALRDDICAAFEALEGALPRTLPSPTMRPAASSARRGNEPTIAARQVAAV